MKIKSTFSSKLFLLFFFFLFLMKEGNSFPTTRRVPIIQSPCNAVRIAGSDFLISQVNDSLPQLPLLPQLPPVSAPVHSPSELLTLLRSGGGVCKNALVFVESSWLDQDTELTLAVKEAPKKGVALVIVGTGADRNQGLWQDLQSQELPEAGGNYEFKRRLLPPYVPPNSLYAFPPRLAQINGVGFWSDQDLNVNPEKPASSSLVVANFDIKDTVKQAAEWYKTTVENAALLRAENSANAISASPSFGALIWMWNWSYESHPGGKLNAWGGWRQLANDGDSKYDWYSIEFFVQTVPDKRTSWWEFWECSGATNDAVVNKNNASGFLWDYDPTTTEGATTSTYTVSASPEGGEVGYSKSIEIPDHRVLDCGDKSRQKACWEQVFGGDPRSNTFLFKPSLVVRVNTGTTPWASLNYAAKFESVWRSVKLKVWGTV
ncbi:MAG: hypothetical protein JST85_28825 [Acidobacteria bacterium]|nr:hypothetical protein [Acidobacteriota bacterium]